MDNVRIVNGDGRADCAWTVTPGDAARIAWSWRILAEYRDAEPDSGWHLETRGDIAPWHDWASDDPA